MANLTPTLETERLTLRPLVREDAATIQALFNDWEVVKWLNAVVPWPYPPDGAEEFLTRNLPEVARGDRFLWAITLKEDPEYALIGVIDLFPKNPDDNRGFWLGSAFHGKGYMSEAAAAVTDFAFDVLYIPFLVLGNAEPNLASHRLKEKTGAEIIEIQEDVEFVGGRYRSIKWRLTREAWERHRLLSE